jgi:hypothetical protein
MLTLSQVLQKGLADLGRTDTFTASNGSATTIDRDDLDALTAQPLDNYAIGFSLFVNKTTDGLAPQGEFGLVNAYESGNHRYTLKDDLSAVAEAGDEIIIADSLFPLREMIQRANRGLEKLEEILATDTSLTTAANQTEYTLPAKIVRRPYLIEIQTRINDADDNQYVPISDWDVQPSTPGSDGMLIFNNQPEADRKLKIWYGGVHPTLTTYSSQVSETVWPSVSVAVFVEAALEWFVGRISGSRSNVFWVQRWNDAKRNAAIELSKHPVPKPDQQDIFFEADRSIYNPDQGYYMV